MTDSRDNPGAYEGVVGVIGAGAMGASLAALLGSVARVALVCRNPDRAASIIRDGAIVTGLLEAQSSPIVLRRIADLASFNDLRLVFVATKTGAIPGVAQELAPVLRRCPAEPSVVSYQNGIESGRSLMQLLESDRVLRMVLNLGVTIDQATGHALVTFNATPHAIGSVDPALRSACEHVAALLSAAGLETTYDAGIESRVWVKGIINAAGNPVTALINGTVGQALDGPSRVILERLIAEGERVARAEGIALGDGFHRAAMAQLELARDHVPSMVEDIRGGRETEIGQLNEQIIAHAREHAIPVPTHELIDALISTFDWRVYQTQTRAGGNG